MINEQKLIERIRSMPDTCNLFQWRSARKIKEGLVSIIIKEPKVGINDMHNIFEEEHRMYKAAMEALCKQIPMKIEDIRVNEYYCPACGSENNCNQGEVTDKYCPMCGQRIYHKFE